MIPRYYIRSNIYHNVNYLSTLSDVNCKERALWTQSTLYLNQRHEYICSTEKTEFSRNSEAFTSEFLENYEAFASEFLERLVSSLLLIYNGS